MIKKRADQFFRWFCHPDYFTDIRGDLEELYAQKREQASPIVAELFYLKEVLLLLRWSLLRPSLFGNLLSFYAMNKTHLKLALRLMWRQKSYSAIKIGGFALGITTFLLLAIYWHHEQQYDNFYPKKDRLYRVTTKYLDEGFHGVHYPSPFAEALVNDFPEIEQAARLIPVSWFNQVRPLQRDQNFHEEHMAYVDPSLVDMLDLHLVFGERHTVLTEPRMPYALRGNSGPFVGAVLG